MHIFFGNCNFGTPGITTLSTTAPTFYAVLGAAELADAGINLPVDAEFGYSVAVYNTFAANGALKLVVGAPGMYNQRGAVFIIACTVGGANTHMGTSPLVAIFTLKERNVLLNSFLF
jgi:hypothetical protein